MTKKDIQNLIYKGDVANALSKAKEFGFYTEILYEYSELIMLYMSNWSSDVLEKQFKNILRDKAFVITDVIPETLKLVEVRHLSIANKNSKFFDITPLNKLYKLEFLNVNINAKRGNLVATFNNLKEVVYSADTFDLINNLEAPNLERLTIYKNFEADEAPSITSFLKLSQFKNLKYLKIIGTNLNTLTVEYSIIDYVCVAPHTDEVLPKFVSNIKTKELVLHNIIGDLSALTNNKIPFRVY